MSKNKLPKNLSDLKNRSSQAKPNPEDTLIETKSDYPSDYIVDTNIDNNKENSKPIPTQIPTSTGISSFDYTAENQPKSEDKEEIQALKNQIAQLEAQLTLANVESKDWQNKAFRYVADLDNSRKQQELDNIQSRKNTKKIVTKPILEFINNQYLVLSFFKTIEDPQIKKSISTLNISFSKLILDLQMQSIEVLIPQVDDEFNPEFMQALNSPEETSDAKVQNIVSLGLRIDNQIIQPTMVMI